MTTKGKQQRSETIFDKWHAEWKQKSTLLELQRTAVFQCCAVNPDNPQAVAENISELHRVARLIYSLGLNETRKIMLYDVLSKMEVK